MNELKQMIIGKQKFINHAYSEHKKGAEVRDLTLLQWQISDTKVLNFDIMIK